MATMSTTRVIPIAAARDRSARVARAMDARRGFRDHDDRRARERRGGRAWLNGSELGGARAALAYLADSYD
jgi:hypothetical protein